MTDMGNDIPQDVQQGAPTRGGTERTVADTIQVLVLSPDGTPRLQTIENHLDALEALACGPFNTFPTGIEGTLGVANVEDAGLGPLPNHAVDGTGTSISGTFVVAGDAGDGVTLQSISPLQLEQALERFAPTLPLTQFEQIVHSHPLGPEWIANWEPPEM